MKQLLYIFCIVALSACNSNKQEPAQTYAPTPKGLEGIKSSAGNTAPTSNQTNTNSGALNPEHGQPGHRCEIAVGAPLSSAPSKTTSTQQVTTNQPASESPSSTPVTTEKGQKLNPAHGMPGHNCAIAVGAPLS